jgi:hypothetical protein
VLAQSAVVVYAEDQSYQATCTFFAPVDVPPNQIRELLEPALARLDITHPLRLPEVFMEEYTPSGSAIRYRAKVFVPYEYRLDYARSVMMERIWYSLARAGISIPTAVESTINNYKIPLIYSRDSATNTSESVLSVLRHCQIFSGLSEAALELLATKGKRQIFAANETLERQGAGQTMHVVLRGLLVVPVLQELRQDDIKSQSYIWSASVLDQIRQQYAVYMGPAAKVLIEEVAQKTSDPYHLYEMLAEEIPNENERQEFKRLRPAFPSKEIIAGGYFGELQLFAGQVPDDSTPLARQESELLEISPVVINTVVAHDVTFLEVVSANLAQAHGLGPSETLALRKYLSARYKMG